MYCGKPRLTVYCAVRTLCHGSGLQLPAVDPGPVHVHFVLDKAALTQVFIPVFRHPPVTVMPPLLRIQLHLHVALIKRTNWRNLGMFQKTNRRASVSKVLAIFFFLYSDLLCAVCASKRVSYSPLVT
jgi:hypothetical protein